MSNAHSTAYSAVNLIFNGGFESGDPKSPSMWVFDNLNEGDTNTKEVVDGALRVVLTSTTTSSMGQDFKAFSAPMDFPVPLPAGVEPTISSGYQVAGSRLIPRNVPLTLAFDINKEVGSVVFKVFYVTQGQKTYVDDVIQMNNTS